MPVQKVSTSSSTSTNMDGVTVAVRCSQALSVRDMGDGFDAAIGDLMLLTSTWASIRSGGGDERANVVEDVVMSEGGIVRENLCRVAICLYEHQYCAVNEGSRMKYLAKLCRHGKGVNKNRTAVCFMRATTAWPLRAPVAPFRTTTHCPLSLPNFLRPCRNQARLPFRGGPRR